MNCWSAPVQLGTPNSLTCKVKVTVWLWRWPALTWIAITTGLYGQCLQLDKGGIKGNVHFRFWQSVSAWKVNPSNKIDVWSKVTPTLHRGPSQRRASCRTLGAEFQLRNVWWQQVTFSVAAAHWIEINYRPAVWGASRSTQGDFSRDGIFRCIFCSNTAVKQSLLECERLNKYYVRETAALFAPSKEQLLPHKC